MHVLTRVRKVCNSTGVFWGGGNYCSILRELYGKYMSAENLFLTRKMNFLLITRKIVKKVVRDYDEDLLSEPIANTHKVREI